MSDQCTYISRLDKARAKNYCRWGAKLWATKISHKSKFP